MHYKTASRTTTCTGNKGIALCLLLLLPLPPGAPLALPTRNPIANQMPKQVYAVVLALALLAALAVNKCRAHALPGAQHPQGPAADQWAARSCRQSGVVPGAKYSLRGGARQWRSSTGTGGGSGNRSSGLGHQLLLAHRHRGP